MTFEKDNIEAAKIKSEIIVNCNNKMNYNAFTPGSRDFALGLKYLKKLESQSNLAIYHAIYMIKKIEKGFLIHIKLKIMMALRLPI